MQKIYTLNNIEKAAQEFWVENDQSRVFAFHGSMGAGKTTFIHALCDQKKVMDVVSSPTFSLINEYYFEENGEEQKIYHIDLYRLKDEEEAIQAGIEDCIYSIHICLIEWPEKIIKLLPADSLHVYIEPVDSQTRRLSIGDN
ncbi:MAG: tRNA (adenosine(37)-N6)-threonylcarbamoyltransferase complex ATPase subunit type 1 TsaE [Chitinophagaceae bacterium]